MLEFTFTQNKKTLPYQILIKTYIYIETVSIKTPTFCRDRIP